jgi:hypothetical protein
VTSHTECLNGGTLNGNACVCPKYFTDIDCGVPICLHGGQTDGQRCYCTPQWTGVHCETGL